MNYEKGKPGTIKEVKKARERKNRQRKLMVNYLKGKGHYANNTSYNKQFRQHKLIQMINEITYYLYVEEGEQHIITADEQLKLLCLIRVLSQVLDAKTPANKQGITRRLKELEELSDELSDEGNNEQ